MSEYIIEWAGIGARITELVGSETPCLAVKHLREERLREEIVRCRDCRYARKTDAGMDCNRHILCARFKPDGFCAWGESKEQ